MSKPTGLVQTKLKPKDIPVLYKCHASLKQAWQSLKGTKKFVSWSTFQAVYRLAVAEGLMPNIGVGAKTKDEMKDPAQVVERFHGQVRATEELSMPLPKKGVKRFIFTSAQNNTKVFMPFWQNLLVLADHYNAEVHVSRLVYIHAGLGARGDKFNAIHGETDFEPEKPWWDGCFEPYFSDKMMEVAPGLVWVGNMTILPTAVRPLSGLEVHTGRRSAIFPHTKLAMESVPSTKHSATKFNYTTGTATLRNYIQRKAGQKADFHHCYGAILVEVDTMGDWFVRQINADSEGVIYDLDIKVSDRELTTGNQVEAITWGDVHVAQIVPWVKKLCWGDGGMLDALKPRMQFYHDVLDFRAQSHHELKKPHVRFKRWLNGETDVQKECADVVKFFEDSQREWCKGVVVHSNHHDHLGRWLEEQVAIHDPKNAEFWTAMTSAVFKSIRKGADKPNYFRLMLEELNAGVTLNMTNLEILEPDESYIICPDKNGGIECGAHGHSGPNGSRGSPKALSKLGRKANVGHVHNAGIIDGIYHSGTCSKLDPDWTTGPSSWSHTHTITYANGKRALVTMWNNKWRA